VTRWTPPDHTAGITGADFDRCAAAIRAGKWKASSQAKDWVGIPVAKTLGLNLGTKTDKAKVRALLEMWLNAGSLCEEEEHDEKQRRKKKFIKVASED
jgi:hypothetical protein